MGFTVLSLQGRVLKIRSVNKNLSHIDRCGLTFKLALGSSGPISPLDRITKWLEKISYKLRVSNDCAPRIPDIGRVIGDTVEVHKELVVL